MSAAEISTMTCHGDQQRQITHTPAGVGTHRQTNMHVTNSVSQNSDMRINSTAYEG